MSTLANKRLAFIDLMFSWPPHGGADVDLYQTIEGLRGLGYKPHLFFAGYETSWERGCAEPAALPFPATRIDFSPYTLRPRAAARLFRDAVDAWRPDVVIVCHGFFLKPFIVDALAHYPLVGRYYAYELVCPRDALLFKNGAPCPNNYLRTPDVCRRCALAYLKDRLTQWRMVVWTHEYLVAGAFMPGYHRRLVESARRFDAVIVYNEIMRAHLRGINDHVQIFPGGVNIGQFTHEPPQAKKPGERKIILMSGRVDEPAKGLQTLLAAGALLAKERSDFEIWATHTNPRLSTDWFKAIGWHPHDRVMEFLRQADICVVPSIWEEPFGLAALEAMAAGRPVCAACVGGLQGIVRHEETGFLFGRGDGAELARQLARLLDDADLRVRMGKAGRRLAEQEYDWARVVETHWPPLLERILS
jgi:glycosyltransferase involved in cell wall biosynthesis